MPDGFLGGWLQAEQQRMAQEQARRQGESHQLQTLGGLLSLQNTMRDQSEQEALRQAVVMSPTGEVDPQKTLANIYKINPVLGMKLQASLQKQTQFGKVDPKDYTPESISRFSKTGDHSVLVPVRKLEYIDTGTSRIPVNPYNNQPGGMPIPVGVSPNTQATVGERARQFDTLSAAERLRIPLEAARTGANVSETFFNTGQEPWQRPGGMIPGGQPIPQSPRPGMMGQQEINQFSPQASAVQNPALAQTEQRIRGAELQPGGGGMIPSSSVLPRGPVIASVPPKAQAQMRIDQPQAQTAATSTLQNLDRLDNMTAELINHPGLDRVTGLINQYQALDVFPETRNARALSGAITKQVGLAALQSMREASKTGGAVGQVTEREWPILQQSIAALDQAQTTDAYKTALTNLRNQITQSRTRVRQAYEQSYGRLDYEAAPHARQGVSPSATPTGLNESDVSVLRRADAIIGR